MHASSTGPCRAVFGGGGGGGGGGGWVELKNFDLLPLEGPLKKHFSGKCGGFFPKTKRPCSFAPVVRIPLELAN